MSTIRAPRWALSFADLCLLLLGFFVILHAQAGHRAELAGGMRAAFGTDKASHEVHADYTAAALFEPGEAVLKPSFARELTLLGARAAAADARVSIESTGTDVPSHRFDGWDLAAARVSAIARAVSASGLPENRIEIAIPAMGGAKAGKGQTIAVRVR
jgi:hypothetical protein